MKYGPKGDNEEQNFRGKYPPLFCVIPLSPCRQIDELDINGGILPIFERPLIARIGFENEGVCKCGESCPILRNHLRLVETPNPRAVWVLCEGHKLP